VRTLADRLRVARERSFVGRRAERDLFAAALAGAPGAFSVLYLYGPGGIGKSALLQRLADDARDAGRPVVTVDGRLTGPAPPAFAAAAAPALAGGAVLIIDTFERCQGLESWLSRQFLPRLPYDVLVVIASRNPPDPSWRTDAAWSDALRIITLRNLAPDESAALMADRGVPADRHAQLLAFAGGHPLGLTLAAEVAARDTSGAQSWAPDRDIVGTLLRQLVGELPSARHRQALEVCAHAEFTTEDLLRAALSETAASGTGMSGTGMSGAGAGGAAAGLFEWLRGLPFVETGPRGVYPHDIVRAALEADLRWRDPDGYAAMHRAVRSYWLDRVQEPGADIVESTRMFLFLYRTSPLIERYFHRGTADDIYADPFRPQDRAAVLALSRQAEGPRATWLAAYWLDRQPGAFLVCRRATTGEPVAFHAWLRLSDPDEEAISVDPVVAAAWAHSQEHGAPRPGEHLAVSRFLVYPPAYHRPSPVANLMQFKEVAQWLRGNGLAWSFVVAPDPGFWSEPMAGTEHSRIAAAPVVDGTPYALFAHDWRRAPLDPFLERQSARLVTSGVVAEPVDPDYAVLARPEFDDAVRAALRALPSAGLADSVLTRTRLIGAVPGPDRARALRALLSDAIAALAGDPREAKLHRVLDATYQHGAPTQEAAAATLRLPFSTYRRHLTAGLELLCDRLWARELGSAPPDS
jgi:hypothetical protein